MQYLLTTVMKWAGLVQYLVILMQPLDTTLTEGFGRTMNSVDQLEQTVLPAKICQTQFGAMLCIILVRHLGQ